MTEFEKIYQNYNPRQAALDEARALLTAADHGFAHRHGHHLAGALDSAAFLDADVGAQQHDGDGILLQVLSHAVLAVVKLEQLARHALFQTTGTGDAVAHQDDRAHLALLNDILVMLDLSTDDLRDLFRFQLHCCVFTTQFFGIFGWIFFYSVVTTLLPRCSAAGWPAGSGLCRPARCPRCPGGCRPAHWGRSWSPGRSSSR